MATPSVKTTRMEGSLTKLFGFDRRDSIAANQCVPAPIGCGQPAVEFKNEISRKEYSMSGVCQECQDSFFQKEE